MTQSFDFFRFSAVLPLVVGGLLLVVSLLLTGCGSSDKVTKTTTIEKTSANQVPLPGSSSTTTTTTQQSN